jgi:hypothetical protein
LIDRCETAGQGADGRLSLDRDNGNCIATRFTSP